MSVVTALIFCVYINTVLCVDPTVTITSTEPRTNNDNTILAKRDHDVTLSCYVENLPTGTQVRWQRKYYDQNGREQTEPVATDQGVVDNTRYGIEKPTSFTWRLRIRSIPVAYEGTYKCYVQVVLQIKTFQERKIRVFVVPSLIPAQTSSDMTVKEGDTVDLLCNATGLPRPRIEWSRQGKALLPLGKEKHVGAKMTVVNIQYHHRGIYRCVAENEIGSVTRNIEVKVKFKPKVNAVQTTVYQAPGYVTELQCIVEANPDPDPQELSWHRAATKISTSSGRFQIKTIRGAFNRLTYELRIAGVRDEDYGEYKCQAGNSIGLTQTSVYLQKADSPRKSVKLGMVIGAASTLSFCLSTLIMTLMVVLVHHL